MLPNRTEHWLADQAAVHAGGVPVTFYATLAPEQIAYTAQDATRGSRCSTASPNGPGAAGAGLAARLKKIIVRDPAACPAEKPYLSWAEFAAMGERRLAADPGAVARRVAQVGPDDPVTVLYTPGRPATRRACGSPTGTCSTRRLR